MESFWQGQWRDWKAGMGKDMEARKEKRGMAGWVEWATTQESCPYGCPTVLERRLGLVGWAGEQLEHLQRMPGYAEETYAKT